MYYLSLGRDTVKFKNKENNTGYANCLQKHDTNSLFS